MNSGTGTLIAFATAPGTTASDNPDGANGLFTTFLLEAMDQPGLGLGQVFDRVRLKLYDASRGLQLSYATSSVLGDFYFRPPATTASAPAPAAAPAPVVATSASSVNGLRTENWNRCRSDDHDIRIVGCTAVIQIAQDSPADLAVAYLNRGSSFLFKRRPQPALQDFDRSIQLDKTNHQVFFKRAWVHNENAEHAQALADLDEALRLSPRTVEYLSERGYANRRLGQYDRALQDYGRVIELAPSAEAYNYRGLVFRDQGDQGRAIQDYTEALRQDPSHFDSLTNRGIAYITLRQYDRALPDLTAVLQQAPTSAWALYARGVARRLSGDAAGGDADMADAKRLQADIAENLSGLGVLLTPSRPPAAPAASPAAAAPASAPITSTASREDNWTACRGSDPRRNMAACSAIIQSGREGASDLAIAYASRAFYSGEDNDRVIQDLTEAIRLSPRVDSFYSNRGLAYQRRSDEDRALADYNQAITLSPKNVSPATYYNRALIYVKRGDDTLALKDLSVYVDRERKDADGFFVRAAAYYRTGDYNRAISDYSKALGSRTDWALAFYGRGLAKQRKGDTRGGAADMAKGRELGGSDVPNVMASGFGVKP